MDAKFLEYCVKNRILSQAVVNEFQSQPNTSNSGYEQLVKMGVISQEQLAVSAGEFYDCQVVDLSKVKPEPNATAYGNATDCFRFQFIPFAIEPAGALLVALADYALLQGAQMILRAARVERMKFYIAPVITLNTMLLDVYGPAEESVIPVTRQKRSMSILRTQFLDFDLSNLRKDNSGQDGNASSNAQTQALDARKLQAMSIELAACHEENAQLRARVDQLIGAVELESSLIRELAKLLNNSGILDSKTYECWLSNQR